MSSIAVFLVLGGATAIAAGQLGKNSVGSKQLKKNAVTAAKIKKNAVTTSKIKNGAITGAKVNAGSLGTVPNATHANNADSAGNANTVNGLRIVKFSLNGGENISKTEILNLNGLNLYASCSSGEETLIAMTSFGESEISAWAEDASDSYTGGEGNYDDEFFPGEEFAVPLPTSSDVIGDGAYTGGDLRTVRFFYNEEDDSNSTECLLNGYAIG
ncbi:MAG TPA: hypothetical protein VI039_09575 [Solirubrobacterales bacterium]